MNTEEVKLSSDAQKPKWVLLPNGKMWKMVDGRISGIVEAQAYEQAESLEHRLDMISDEATGFVCGLTDFGYQYLGAGLVKFWGTVGEMIIDEEEGDEEGLKEVNPSSEEFYLQLIEQYGMSEVEAKHACENLENEYGEETVVKLANGREVRTAVYPDEASYVRVCLDGFELAYWVNDEWREAGEDVMGAIIGCMKRDMRRVKEEATC